MAKGCNDPVENGGGSDDLLSVKVRKYDWESPEDWLGCMRISKGYTEERITKHMKEHFNSDQFKIYKFYIYKRVYGKTCNPKWIEVKEIYMKNEEGEKNG